MNGKEILLEERKRKFIEDKIQDRLEQQKECIKENYA